MSPLYILKACNKMFPEPSLVHAEQPQLLQSGLSALTMDN